MAISTITVTMMIISWLSLPLAIVTMVSISPISMRISMMIVSRGSLCFPLAIVTVMAVSTIRVSVAMMIIPGLSIGLPLAIVSMVAVSMAISMRVTMMIISWLSISFSNGSWLSLSLAVVAMMVISWLSNSCAEDGKGYSNQKIPHVLCVETT